MNGSSDKAAGVSLGVGCSALLAGLFNMTPTQEREYSIFRDCGWEYEYTETDGTIIMARWDRGADHASRLAEMATPKDGASYRVQFLSANISFVSKNE